MDAKTMKYLTNVEAGAALEEGWAVFDIGGGVLEIQRDDECAILSDDDEAVALVERRAAEGSLLHRKALNLATNVASVTGAN